jgi:hypothetical protein
MVNETIDRKPLSPPLALKVRLLLKLSDIAHTQIGNDFNRLRNTKDRLESRVV